MTLRHNLDPFRREALATVAAIREDANDRINRIGVFAFAEIQQNSPVRTGAYNAEHVVEQDGSPIYEHPDRLGPDTEIPVRFSEFGEGGGGAPARQIDPHSLRSVANALEGSIELQGFSIVNRRFYAETLENGSARSEPRRIYARAAQATEAQAQVIAAEPPKSPLLRGTR